MLRFSNQDDFFEMDVSLVEDASVQSVNGAVVAVRVNSSGFVGRSDLWVHAQELEQFAKSLIQLERSLKGEAVLASMSPNELDLKGRSA